MRRKAKEETEAERKLTELGRQASFMRDRAGLLERARNELKQAGNAEFTPAVAYLQGMIRTYYECAREIDDVREDDGLPF